MSQIKDIDGNLVSFPTVNDDGLIDADVIPTTGVTQGEVDASISTHNSDATAVHGIADTSLLDTIALRNAAIDAAINALIGTAPGTLNTLGEISDAINDDASLYATLVALINAKQAGHAILTALSGLTIAANKLPYGNGSNTFAVTDLTAAGRSMIGAASAGAQLDALGLSAFIKTLVDDADGPAALTTLGITAAAQTVLDDTTVAAMRATLGLNKRPISVSIGDPNGSVLVAGVKAIVRVPFAWTDIESASIVGDASGSIIFTVRKATWNVAPSWSSIVSSAPPTLSGAVAVTDATLTGWTKTGSAGDLLEIGVSGTPSTVKLASLTLVLVQ